MQNNYLIGSQSNSVIVSCLTDHHNGGILPALSRSIQDGWQVMWENQTHLRTVPHLLYWTSNPLCIRHALPYIYNRRLH